MLGRLDTEPTECPACLGKGKDTRNRKRPCPRCEGTGKVDRSRSCGHLIPCPGTDNNVFDQTYCNKPNPN